MHKFRQKYIGDKAFYKRYLMLAIPMIIQNAITNLVSFLDNIMVGQLGTEQMSGVAIVNQLIFVYNLAVFGAVSAASIFGAQYFGKGNHKGHMYSFRFKLYAALLVTAIAMTLFITNGTGFHITLSDRYGRKRCHGGSTGIWKGISGNCYDRSYTVCGDTGLCDKHKGNRTDFCTDGCKLCSSWKQCGA